PLAALDLPTAQPRPPHPSLGSAHAVVARSLLLPQRPPKHIAYSIGQNRRRPVLSKSSLCATIEYHASRPIHGIAVNQPPNPRNPVARSAPPPPTPGAPRSAFQARVAVGQPLPPTAIRLGITVQRASKSNSLKLQRTTVIDQALSK
ncbi:hypothetical protein EJB05_55056, partial [Eragrostis curvula]